MKGAVALEVLERVTEIIDVKSISKYKHLKEWYIGDFFFI